MLFFLDINVNLKFHNIAEDLNNEKNFSFCNRNCINENGSFDNITISTTKCDKRFKRRLSKSDDDCPLLIKNRAIDSSNIEM